LGRRERRNKLEIYTAILSAINHELPDGEVKPTRVQFLSNMSYDKVTNYLNELVAKELITKEPITLTDRGKEFLQDYDLVKDFIQKMKLEYISKREEFAYGA
jgi:predicted transcriptional regulator